MRIMMIKYEHNTLVLDASHNKNDQKAVNDFIAQIQRDERKRILEEVERLEQQSHQTRTPLYQETIFSRLKDMLV